MRRQLVHGAFDRVASTDERADSPDGQRNRVGVHQPGEEPDGEGLVPDCGQVGAGQQPSGDGDRHPGQHPRHTRSRQAAKHAFGQGQPAVGGSAVPPAPRERQPSVHRSPVRSLNVPAARDHLTGTSVSHQAIGYRPSSRARPVLAAARVATAFSAVGRRQSLGELGDIAVRRGDVHPRVPAVGTRCRPRKSSESQAQVMTRRAVPARPPEHRSGPDDPEELPGLGQPLQDIGSAVVERDTGANDQIAHRPGCEDLTG
jgi:hypothetical protein